MQIGSSIRAQLLGSWRLEIGLDGTLTLARAKKEPSGLHKRAACLIAVVLPATSSKETAAGILRGLFDVSVLRLCAFECMCTKHAFRSNGEEHV